MPPAKLLQSGLAVGKASPSCPCLFFVCLSPVFFSSTQRGTSRWRREGRRASSLQYFRIWSRVVCAALCARPPNPPKESPRANRFNLPLTNCPLGRQTDSRSTKQPVVGQISAVGHRFGFRKPHLLSCGNRPVCKAVVGHFLQTNRHG